MLSFFIKFLKFKIPIFLKFQILKFFEFRILEFLKSQIFLKFRILAVPRREIYEAALDLFALRQTR